MNVMKIQLSNSLRNVQQGQTGDQTTGKKGSGERGGEERRGASQRVDSASVVVGFHYCSVVSRGTAAAPGPYDLFQLCNSQQHRPGLRDDPATGQTHPQVLAI